jgi:hypothetical protein
MYVRPGAQSRAGDGKLRTERNAIGHLRHSRRIGRGDHDRADESPASVVAQRQRSLTGNFGKRKRMLAAADRRHVL